MQQQIQSEGPLPTYNTAKTLSSSSPSHFSSFSPLPSTPHLNTLPGELISEHYEQDFDQLSQQITNQPQEIKEELSMSDQQLPNRSKLQQRNEELQVNETLLAQQCRLMSQQINILQRKISESKFQSAAEEQIEEGERGEYSQLLTMRQINAEILQKQQKELLFVVSTRFGNNSLSIQYILNESHTPSTISLEEQLLSQIAVLQAEIQQKEGEVMRLSREVNKNSQLLPDSEAEKEQMYARYKAILRQIEEKKEKFQANADRSGQQQQKITELTTKIKAKEQKYNQQAIQQVSADRQKHKALLKQKQTEEKLNSIASHNSLNAAVSLQRSIKELRKQITLFSQRIQYLQSKNIELDSLSEKMLEKFKSCNVSPTCSKKTKETKPKDMVLDAEVETPGSILIRRKKDYSQTKKSSQASNRISSKAYLTEPLAAASSRDLPLEQLNQSATDNSLQKKQFKLKLPTQTVKKSEKTLKNSQQVEKDRNAPYFITKKNNNSKLSVTQRLEKIELLEQQDRLQSYKLYNLRHHSLHRQRNINKEVSSNDERDLFNQTDIQTPEPQNKMSSSKSFQLVKNKESERVANLLRIDKKDRSMYEPKGQDTVEKKLIHLPTFTNNNQSKASVTKMQKPAHPKTVQLNFLSQTDFPHPEKLFSSIQKKLISRQSSLRESLRIQSKDQQPELKDSEPTRAGDAAKESEVVKEMLDSGLISTSMSSMGLVSRLPVFRRRATLKQKKITDDYMRILEERGRKILQLDSQCQQK